MHCGLLHRLLHVCKIDVIINLSALTLAFSACMWDLMLFMCFCSFDHLCVCLHLSSILFIFFLFYFSCSSTITDHFVTLFVSVIMSKPTLLVLYGSQTGTAQDTAQRIGRQAQRRQLQVQVLPLDNYNVVSVVLARRGDCYGSDHF